MKRKPEKPEETKTIPYEKDLWGPGPWMEEPDRLEFEAEGFQCLTVRNTMGAWCGYVGVPKSHAAYGRSYDDMDSDVNVHGGLTYSEHCHWPVCHVPKPGQPDDLWWVGFDCAHLGDIVPSMVGTSKLLKGIYGLTFTGFTGQQTFREMTETYKDQDYIRVQTAYLAHQLARMGFLWRAKFALRSLKKFLSKIRGNR